MVPSHGNMPFHMENIKIETTKSFLKSGLAPQLNRSSTLLVPSATTDRHYNLGPNRQALGAYVQYICVKLHLLRLHTRLLNRLVAVGDLLGRKDCFMDTYLLSETPERLGIKAQPQLKFTAIKLSATNIFRPLVSYDLSSTIHSWQSSRIAPLRPHSVLQSTARLQRPLHEPLPVCQLLFCTKVLPEISLSLRSKACLKPVPYACCQTGLHARQCKQPFHTQ